MVILMCKREMARRKERIVRKGIMTGKKLSV
jgi:hypothetical protein